MRHIHSDEEGVRFRVFQEASLGKFGFDATHWCFESQSKRVSFDGRFMFDSVELSVFRSRYICTQE